MSHWWIADRDRPVRIELTITPDQLAGATIGDVVANTVYLLTSEA